MESMSSEEKKDLYRKLGNLEAQLARILFMLESDNKTKQSGLVEKVDKLQHQVENLDLENKMFIQKATTYSAVGSAFVVFVGWLVTLLFKYFAE